MKNICIYPNDLDGQCSAAIVNKYFIEQNERLEFLPYDGQEVELNEYDNVIALGLSMLTNNKIILINRSKDRGLCESAWVYFYPKLTPPKTVLYLGMYDSLRDKDQKIWKEKVIPFRIGITLRPELKNPECPSWNNFLISVS